MLVDEGMTAQDIANKYGTHGHIIDFDMGGLLQNLIAEGDSNASIEKIKLVYETYYFSSTGHYVNSATGSISCSDAVFDGNCTTHPGNVFLAWNMRSDKGRLIGTGVYIGRVHIKIFSGKKTISRKARDYMWGIKRVKNNPVFIE